MIYSLYKDRINEDILREAIQETSIHRGTYEMVLEYKDILDLLRNSLGIQNVWKKYTDSNIYAKDIDFEDTLKVYENLGNIVVLHRKR